jgi:RNA polymerase sigma-70 factor (ECF subfamily)
LSGLSSCPHQPDDGTLIQRFVQSGDRTAFEVLVERHLAKIRRYALVLANNDADADEIVQEVLIGLFRKLHTFRGAAAFETWLFQVVRNRGRDVLRRRKAHPTTDIDRFSEVMPGTALAPDELLYQQELSAAVYQRLEKALPIERQLFFLRETEGLSFPEIAKLLGLPEGTVKARRWRFKAKIAQELAPLAEEVKRALA